MTEKNIRFNVKINPKEKISVTGENNAISEIRGSGPIKLSPTPIPYEIERVIIKIICA